MGEMLGLGVLIGQLTEDARALAQAEVKLLKSRALDLFRRSRIAIILLVIAACLAFASVVALMLGLVLALAPLVGAALAGVILMVGGLVFAALLGWLAVRLLAGPPRKPEPETMT
jgi:type III secretory pathway component EscS